MSTTKPIKKSPDIKDGVVAISTLLSAPRLLAIAGAEAATVANRAGIDPESFRDPATCITFGDMGRYLTECVRATGDETFALRVGLAAGPGALDALGYLVVHMPTVRAGIEMLAKYAGHYAGRLTLTEERGLAMIDYAFLFPELHGAALICDAALGLELSIFRAICGPAWLPSQIRIAHRLPINRADWQRYVHAPIYFGAERNLIAFSAKWLLQPIDRADPELRRVLLARVAELHADTKDDFSSSVMLAIGASLRAGSPSLNAIARQLAISPRTLKRRLYAADTSFTQLLESTRMEMACHFLSASTVSMTQLADLLGYSHSSALNRAFLRWKGCTPGAWRERHRSSTSLN